MKALRAKIRLSAADELENVAVVNRHTYAGPQDNSYVYIGRGTLLGKPAILKVSVTQSPEPFVSLSRIASQILALTRLNYKTVTPTVGEPVTLSFSNLVANFMAVFSEHQWKEANETRQAMVSVRPWFL